MYFGKIDHVYVYSAVGFSFVMETTERYFGIKSIWIFHI